MTRKGDLMKTKLASVRNRPHQTRPRGPIGLFPAGRDGLRAAGTGRPKGITIDRGLSLFRDHAAEIIIADTALATSSTNAQYGHGASTAGTLL